MKAERRRVSHSFKTPRWLPRYRDRAAVAERALTVEEVARRFRGARRADVAKHLETLEVLGVVSRLEGERYQVQAVGQAVAA